MTSWLDSRVSSVDCYVEQHVAIVAGNESHAGQVFCCVAALHIAGALDQIDRDLLCWW